MKRQIKYLALLCALFLTLLVGCSSSTTAALTATDYMDLGYQYLSELNYEEAILAFEKAIEIDPMLEDAYILMAQTYVVLGETEQAIAILQQGAEATGSETISSYAENLSSLPSLEQAMSSYAEQGDSSYSDISSDQASQEIENGLDPEIIAEVDEKLADFVAVLDSANNDTMVISQYMLDMEYQDLADDILCLLYQAGLDIGLSYDNKFQEGSQNICAYTYETPNGTLAIYQSCNIYYGDMVDGLRQGQGIWLDTVLGTGEVGYSGALCNLTSCTWENDQPTGAATYMYGWYDAPDGKTLQELKIVQVTGTLLNGLWDGEVTEHRKNVNTDYTTGTSESSEFTRYYSIEEGTIMPVGYDDQGEAIYAVFADGSDGHADGMVGFTVGIFHYADNYM